MADELKGTVGTNSGAVDVKVEPADKGDDKTPQNMKAENQVGGTKKPTEAVMIPAPAGQPAPVKQVIVEGNRGPVATSATATGIATGQVVGDSVLTAESSEVAASKAPETVQMNFPRRVILTVSHSKQIIFEAGLRDVPSEYANHEYLKNNGVTRYDPATAKTAQGFGQTQTGTAGAPANMSVDDMRAVVAQADFDQFMKETSGGFHATDADWTTVGRDAKGFPVPKGSPTDVSRKTGK